ncbi:MAG: sigma 54-interacting transcriptional regulator [Thiotrichaceae bacterium]|nr:sigma 54-interacting transcriptional regulator [Thiotrichaceae bacterium]
MFHDMPPSLTMQNKSLTLQSLLETHEQPFIIIDASLTILSVNRAFEIHFGITRKQLTGKPCCLNNSECRHKRLFERLEPYAGSFPNEFSEETSQINVHGYPLLDNNGVLCLGESISLPSVMEQRYKQIQMVGSCVAFSNFKHKINQAAATNIPVLLSGETGTGKEVAATYLHQQSKRSAGQFVVVDCTILTGDLFESELFGHQKGSYTGATSNKKGLFQLADKGTLFLDEIGELPLSLQPKLLRALESGQYRSLGSTTTKRANVRAICATHRDLAEMVNQGLFREDLYYRLSVFPIQAPPLRERMQDIPVLVDYLLLQAGNMNGNGYSLTQAALIKLLQHQWPGNIRELRNCLQLATGLCLNNIITEQDIIISQVREPVKSIVSSEKKEEQFQTQASFDSKHNLNPIEKMEAEFVTALIKKYNGNRKQIASEMNISERTLYRKLKRLDLNTPTTL